MVTYNNYMYCDKHSRFIASNDLVPGDLEAVDAAVAAATQLKKRGLSTKPASAVGVAAGKLSKKEAVPAKNRELQAAGVIKPANEAAGTASEPKKRKVMKLIQFDVESSD